MECPSCGRQVPDDMSFCGYCRAPLRTASTDASAERRQLTALFCDLVGSTPLSISLDDEDYRDVIIAYRSACVTVINRHEGRVKQFVGDGLLAYFGYPVAHEDDARRAIRTGIEIVPALAALSAELQTRYRISVTARVGIHTGPVVVSAIESSDPSKTLNLAAYIQDFAKPGFVIVSDATYRIARGFFEFTPLGELRVEDAPVLSLYQVLRETDAVSRLDAGRRSGLTPLTGRASELALLKEKWGSVATKGGHAVLLQGELGIGKSRLVDALREHVEQDGATVFECSCTQYAKSTPLFPIMELAERTLGFARETAIPDKRAALEKRLAARGLLTEENAALMAEFLGIAASPAESDPLVNYSPQKKHERTLETLLDWLLAIARERPALFVAEDLHWADPTTIEFLTSVLRKLSEDPLKAAVLVVLTFRADEFSVPWDTNGRASSIALTRLAPDDTSAMASWVAHGKTLPADVLQQIVARADGVPLFAEEITKATLELGVLVEQEDRFEISGPLPPNLIPSTIEESLNVRLDRLGSAKATAQLAATIGREFSYPLLRAVSSIDDTELRRHLDRLIASELVYGRVDSPEETYLFKHQLVRERAYRSMLGVRKRELHKKIGEALTGQFRETADHHPELVAEHFTAAEHWDEAVERWLEGGKKAVDRGANHEAITHLRRGLSLVTKLAPERQLHQELELRMLLFPACIASEGWASAEIGRVYPRAHELADLLGETLHRFKVMAFMMGYHFTAGRVTQSLEMANQVFELASTIGDPSLLTVGHQECSVGYCYRGDFVKAIEHANAGLALLDVARERFLGRELSLSPCVGMLTYKYIAQWMLGFPEQAQETNDLCISLSEEVGHPPSIGFALTARTGWCYLQGDAKETLKSARAALDVAREERLGFWEPMISVFLWWAESELGKRAESVAQIRDALEQYRKKGNGVQQVWMNMMLADAQWKAGQCDDAFNTLAETMRLARENGEGLFEPELYRLEGEFRLQQAEGTADPPKAASKDRMTWLAHAERRIRESLDLARRQGARMLELRSLVSLCKVQGAQATVPPDYETLAKIYNAFIEGLDTRDLRDARAMLEDAGVG